jgi:hypothetical protein
LFRDQCDVLRVWDYGINSLKGVPEPPARALFTALHEASISRDNFERLIVECNYPVAEWLCGRFANVSLVYLISSIKVGNQRRILNETEIVEC